MNKVFCLVTDQPCISLALEFFVKKWNNLKEIRSTPIIRTFKGNRENFELSGVRVIDSKIRWKK